GRGPGGGGGRRHRPGRDRGPARGWGREGGGVEEPRRLPRGAPRRPQPPPRQIACVRRGCEVSHEDLVHAVSLHATPPFVSATRSRLLPRWSWLFTVLIEMPRMRASSP